MKKVIALALAILTSGQAQVAGKEVHAFMTYETFVQLSEQGRQLYVAGLADAFTYLEVRTGRMAGFGECLRQNRVTVRLSEQLIREILDTNPRLRENTLADAFELGNRAACNSYITDDLQKRALE